MPSLNRDSRFSASIRKVSLTMVRATVIGSDSSPLMASYMRPVMVSPIASRFCCAMIRRDHSDTNVVRQKHSMTMAKASLEMLLRFME